MLQPRTAGSQYVALFFEAALPPLKILLSLELSFVHARIRLCEHHNNSSKDFSQAHLWLIWPDLRF